MAFDLKEFDEFEGFEEVSAFSGGADVALVAGIKIVLHGSAVEHLKIEKDDLGKQRGKSRARVKLNKAKKELMLIKVPHDSGGIVLGGKLSSVELYSAQIGKTILEGIGKKLKGAGTISFTDVRMETSKNGTPYLLVKYDEYKANDGVFADDVEEE